MEIEKFIGCFMGIVMIICLFGLFFVILCEASSERIETGKMVSCKDNRGFEFENELCKEKVWCNRHMIFSYYPDCDNYDVNVATGEGDGK